MASIFVSYNRQSEVIVKSVVEDIKTLGHTVWFDQDVRGGQAWWDSILATIRDCDLFVFVLDPESLKSTACRREYGYAADLGKPVLPVLVAEGVSVSLLPPELSKIQFVDYRNHDRNAGLRLARALVTVSSPGPLPHPLPPPPDVPISYLSRLSQQIEAIEPLSYEKQSALLVDLKQSLNDSEMMTVHTHCFVGWESGGTFLLLLLERSITFSEAQRPWKGKQTEIRKARGTP